MRLIAPFIVLTLLVLYARFVEPNILCTKRIRINGNRLEHNVSPIRITLLSDFHYPRFVSFRLVRSAIGLSNDFHPDLVLMLGDFFDKNRHDPAKLPININELFGGIESRYGVFGVLGNHDHWFDEHAIREALGSQTDIQLIDNRSVRLDISGQVLYLAGVGDLWSNNVKYEDAVASVPEEATIILLSHNPDVFADIHDPRILIQFSGHTHGGQVRLPIIGALKVPSKFGNRYARGLVTAGQRLLYVNSGICSMKRIRFMCFPEVTYVEIY